MPADLVPGENLLPGYGVTWPFLGECRHKERVRPPVSSSFYKGTNPHHGAPTRRTLDD